MMRALWTLKPLVKQRLLMEGLVSLIQQDKPVAEYLPAASCNNDITNFWAPNPLCCEMMLQDCGFIVGRRILNDNRGFFEAHVNPKPNADEKTRMAYGFRDA
jgi:hypothetical protein